MARRTQVFFIFAAAVVASLAVLPATGWLVRQQLRVVAADDRQARNEASAAARNPDDFDIQLAWVLSKTQRSLPAVDSDDTTPPPIGADGLRSETVRELLTMREKFDNRPALQAHILRYLTKDDLKLNRDEEKTLFNPAQPQSVNREKGDPVATQAGIAVAVATATRGEYLDPRNAYFPTMLSLALLAQHRDDEAVTALDRAAGKANWDDYAWDEARSRIALLKAAGGGEPGVISRVLIVGSIPFPHLARIRLLGRVMTARAVQRERAGDTEGGLTIRRSLARVGATMRAQSRSILGSEIGMAMTDTAETRPGGAPIPDNTLKGDARIADRDARYVSYLTRIGHPEDAAWFAKERQAANLTKAIIHASTMETVLGKMSPLLYCSTWRLGGILVLQNLFRMLLLGVVAEFLSADLRRRWATPSGRGICLAALFVVCPAVYYGLNCLSLGLIVPVVLMCRFGIRGRMKRLPEPTETVRGFRSTAVPIAGALLLLYAATVVGGAMEESSVRGELDAMITHEGKYQAAIIHEEWPGPVEIPAQWKTAP